MSEFIISDQDAVEWLKGFEEGSVDLCILDPPYQSMEKWRKIGTTTRLKNSKGSSNDWFDVFPDARFEELFIEVYRVLKKNTHFYMFCNSDTMFVAKPIAEKVGFKFWKPLVWEKVGGIGMGYHYRACYEFILFFEKGKRKLNHWSTVRDIIKAPRIYRGYPAEKPVEALEVLVQESSNEGELVIDPFMGSGSTGIAAIRNGRNFSGNDTSEKAQTLAWARLIKASNRQKDCLNTEDNE
jgi:site-specific DNA-methyltransferase (adenine-specific)